MTLDDSFSLKELTESNQDITERDLKLTANFKLPFLKGKYGNSLRFGAKVVDKSKDKKRDFYEYTPVEKTTFNTASFSHTADETNSCCIPGITYQAGTYV